MPPIVLGLGAKLVSTPTRPDTVLTSSQSQIEQDGNQRMPITFDVEKMPVTAGGLVGYFWPLSQAELMAVRDAGAVDLATLARECRPSRSSDSAILSVLLVHLLLDIMAV